MNPETIAKIIESGLSIVDKLMDKLPSYSQIKKNKWLRLKKKWREANKEYEALTVADKKDNKQVKLARLRAEEALLELYDFQTAFCKELS